MGAIFSQCEHANSDHHIFREFITPQSKLYYVPDRHSQDTPSKTKIAFLDGECESEQPTNELYRRFLAQPIESKPIAFNLYIESPCTKKSETDAVCNFTNEDKSKVYPAKVSITEAESLLSEKISMSLQKLPGGIPEQITTFLDVNYNLLCKDEEAILKNIDFFGTDVTNLCKTKTLDGLKAQFNFINTPSNLLAIATYEDFSDASKLCKGNTDEVKICHKNNREKSKKILKKIRSTKSNLTEVDIFFGLIESTNEQSGLNGTASNIGLKRADELRNWVVVRKAATDISLLAHEIAHIFGGRHAATNEGSGRSFKLYPNEPSHPAYEFKQTDNAIYATLRASPNSLTNF